MNNNKVLLVLRDSGQAGMTNIHAMEFEKEFLLAKEVIVEAGELILSYYHKNVQADLKLDQSFVTEADIISESSIRQKLMEYFPRYGFIGEETDAEEKEIAWIIDPLDGTRPFVQHIPEFGIAIALKKHDAIILSVQYLPVTQTILTAYKGKGAYKNNKRISVSKTTDMKRALGSIGMQNFWIEEYKDYTNKIIGELKNKFRVGLCAVLESYYLANGSSDIFIRFDQPIWDIAAEYLLMKEAGAVITDEYGEPLKLHFSKEARHNYIATNPFLAENYNDILYVKR